MTKEQEESSDLGERSKAILFRQAQSGYVASLNALMERHAGLVTHVVNRQQRWGLPYEDALQAGRLWDCGAPFWAMIPNGRPLFPPTPT